MGNLAITGNQQVLAQNSKTDYTSKTTEKNHPNSVIKKKKPTEFKTDTVYFEKKDIISKEEQERRRIERIKKESHEIINKMYEAIDGIGTDNELFEEALNMIDTDNILEVIQLWDFTAGREYGETFIESFLGDASAKQRQNYGNQLIKDLYERVTRDNAPDDPNLFEYQTTSKFIELNKAKFFPNKKLMAHYFNSLTNESDKMGFYDMLDLLQAEQKRQEELQQQQQ